MKQQLKVATVSKRLVIFAQDSSSTVGAGLSGLTNATSGLVWYYWREDTGNANGVAVTPASATRGTWTSGGFKEIDATNLPGYYEIGVPDAVLASGATWAVMMIRGAANLLPLAIEIQLVAFDPTDSTRLGLSALPNGSMTTKKNTAKSGFPFPMYDSNGNLLTGLTVSGQKSLDGGAFSNLTNAVSEISNGWYKVNLAAGDVNGDTVALRFSATGALDSTLIIITQP